MKKIIFITFICIGLALGPAHALSVVRDKDDLKTLTIETQSGKNHNFKVEVVSTPEQRSYGLMHRLELPKDQGMWFVFHEAKEMSFWMRNTFIPLDIIYVKENGIIHHIHENAIPHDETPIPSNGPVRYVLEINGGLATKHNIQPGDKINWEN